MNRDELVGVAARMVLELAGPEDLPGAAVVALEGGLDSPASVALAGADASEARPLFDLALEELKISKPSPREAVMRLAHDATAGIAGGTMAPYAGAKRIWELTSCVPTVRIPELDPFIYATNEWEERPADRIHFEQGIISEAHALLAR